MMKRVIECQERILKLMLVFMLAITLLEIPVVKEAIQDPTGINNIEAQEEVPNIKKGTVTWEQYASIMIGGHQHTALSDGGKFLAQTISDRPYTYDEATEFAKPRWYVYDELGVSTASPEWSILESSLAGKVELEAASEDGNPNILNKTIYANPQQLTWWMSNTAEREGIKLASVVTGNNDLLAEGVMPDVAYEVGAGGTDKACEARSFAFNGVMPRAQGILGSGIGLSGEIVPAVTCGHLKMNKLVTYDIYPDPGCKGIPKQGYAQSLPGLALPAGEGRLSCLMGADSNVAANTCYATEGRTSFMTAEENLDVISFEEWNDTIVGGYADTRECTTAEVKPGMAMLRPNITITNPETIVFASNSTEMEDTNPVSPSLQEYKPITNMVNGSSYKLTLSDTTQAISEVSQVAGDKNIQKYDADTNTVYVAKNATSLNLNTTNKAGTVVGATVPNRISALAYDLNQKALYGHVGNITNKAGEISIDLSTLLDTSKLGETKSINLYSEQTSAAGRTNFIASTPFKLNVVVAEEQKLELDDASKSIIETTYGDEITLRAAVNNSDIGRGWSTGEDMDLLFSIPNEYQSFVEITKQEFDATTGIASVTLNPLTGSSKIIEVAMNKKGSLAQGYFDAVEVLSQAIILQSRGITIIPKAVSLNVGDAYPPSWEFDITRSDGYTGNGLVNKDILPYDVKTAKLTATMDDVPVFDNKVEMSANGKTWKLLLKDGDPTAVTAFLKKYDVVKKDYETPIGAGDKTRILSVAKMNFAPPTIIEGANDSMALLNDDYRFTVKANYPTQDEDGKTISPEYQRFSYQWYKKEPGKDWTELNTNTSVSYKEGVATIIYNGKNAQEADHGTLFKCHVWNAKNAAENERLVSREGLLKLVSEPVGFVQVPAQVQLGYLGSGIAGNRDIDKDYNSNIIKLNEDSYAAGKFKIMTEPTIRLTLNGLPTLKRDEYYDVNVYQDDGTKVPETKFLMELFYDNQREKRFYLRTQTEVFNKIGIYKGIMRYTITYDISGNAS